MLGGQQVSSGLSVTRNRGGRTQASVHPSQPAAAVALSLCRLLNGGQPSPQGVCVEIRRRRAPGTVPTPHDHWVPRGTPVGPVSAAQTWDSPPLLSERG